MKKFLYNAVFIFLIADAAILTAINFNTVIEYFLNQDILKILLAVIILLAGSSIAFFISVLIHELGHIIIGLLAGFKIYSFTLFNRETIYHNGKKTKNKIKNNFSFGSCEFINKKEKNIKGRFTALTAGGIIFSFIMMLVYLALNVFLKNANPYIYVFISTGLIISLYIFLSVLLPAQIKGTHTDGAIIYGLTKNKDYTTVLLSLLKIQTELYSGKSPSQIDRELYFNVPLLSDDHISMLKLYFLRQMYYLDNADYISVAKTNQRLLYFNDAMSVEEYNQLQLNIVFDLIKSQDYKKAKSIFDSIKEELKDNLTVCRIKAYYFYYVLEDKKTATEYIEKSKEFKQDNLKGIVIMENNLINNLKNQNNL